MIEIENITKEEKKKVRREIFLCIKKKNQSAFLPEATEETKQFPSSKCAV